jgi:hypothetical protein
VDLRRYGPAGKRLATTILEQMGEDGLEPDGRDAALLDAAATLADRMADLQAMIAKDGKSTTSATGIVRLHPAIAEHRQHAVSLAKVLSGISLHVTSAKSPAKQRAAQTRWRTHNAAKAGA